jgi:hypothetical protein
MAQGVRRRSTLRQFDPSAVRPFGKLRTGKLTTSKLRINKLTPSKLTTGKAKEKSVVADPKMLRYGFDIFSSWIQKIMGSNL